MTVREQPIQNAPGLRRSGWAVAALVCSLVFFCLPLSILGALLGVRALFHIKADARRTGKTMAVASIVIGLIVAGLWASGAIWWHNHVRTPLMSGPIRALEAGYAGDLAGFRDGFTGETALVEDAAIRDFLDEMNGRYGPLLSIRQREEEGREVDDYQMQSYRIPYEMHFEMGPIKAEAKFIIFAPDQGGFVGRFDWLAVYDEEQGDLVFPVSATLEVIGPPPADPIEDNGT